MTTKILPIFLPGDKMAYVMAGPTRELPDGYKLIRCAKEIPVDPERVAFDVSTLDFAPFDDDTIRSSLPDIIQALERGDRLYVGCMGGTGRTGTMLGIIAAQHPAMTGLDAFKYIRAIYKSGAIETEEQKLQVERLAGIYNAPSGPDYGWQDHEAWLDEMDSPAPARWGFRKLWHMLTGSG